MVDWLQTLNLIDNSLQSTDTLRALAQRVALLFSPPVQSERGLGWLVVVVVRLFATPAHATLGALPEFREGDGGGRTLCQFA